MPSFLHNYQITSRRIEPLKRIIYTLTLATTFAAGAQAADVPRTLLPDAVYCFKNGDWNELVEAAADQDEDAAANLVNSGKCRVSSKSLKVMMIEPENDLAPALIVLPSGKTALTSERFMRK